MKKNKLLVLIAIFILAVCTVAFAACGDTERPGNDPDHVHTLEHHDGVPATCTETGFVEYWLCTSCDKAFSDPEGTKELSTVIAPARGHDFADYNVVEPATCTEDGTETAKCSRCDATDTRAVEKLGHSFTNYTLNTAATCTDDATEIAVCDHNCGTSDVRTITGTKAEHKFTNYVENDTIICTQNKTETAMCDFGCGTSHTKIKENSATNHTFVGGTCSVCHLDEKFTQNNYEDLSNDDEQSYRVRFGYYPQSNVTDGAIVAALNSAAGGLPTVNSPKMWIDYGYFYPGDEYPYEAEPRTYMWYIDVPYNGELYRGVYFTIPRPISSLHDNDEDGGVGNSYVSLVYGYNATTAYWFKYEPLTWRILLSGADDTAFANQSFVLCESIIDAQEFYQCLYSVRFDDDENHINANNYEHSRIREWLNETFYETAFNNAMQTKIATTLVDNGIYTTEGGIRTEDFVCNNTNDKVFLLSHSEFFNTAYGFASSQSTAEDNAARIFTATDYAKINGLYGDGNYWLRSPYHEVENNFTTAELISDDGATYYSFCFYNYGVLPAMWIDYKTTKPYTDPSENIDPAIKDATGDNAVGTEGLQYALGGNGEYYMVTGYTGTASDVVVPAMYEGKAVRGIAKYAFFDKHNVTSISLPVSVTYMGLDAFTGDADNTAPMITKVYYRGALKDWCEIFFAKGTAHPLSYFGGDLYIGGTAESNKITALAISADITSIADYAFFNCDGITSVTFAGSTSIGNYAFDYCGGLNCAITINGGSIGKYAFGYSAVTDVTINGVVEIGQHAFDGCKKLKTVTLGEGLEVIGDSAFYSCSNAAFNAIVIPDSVITIGNNAFYGCLNIAELTLGNSVETIGNGAFDGTAIFGTLTFPASLYSIGEFSFRGCSQITGITIPSTLTHIGAGAFQGTGIRNITLPAHITEIPDNLFAGCSFLTRVTLQGNVTSIGKMAFYGCEKLTALLTPGTTSGINIPDGITVISKEQFAGCSLIEEIVLPASVKTIERWAFHSCDNLGSINLEHVEHIESNAFDGTFTEVDLSSIVTLEQYAFNMQSSLEKVTIGEGLMSLGKGAFKDCSPNLKITFKGTRASWNALVEASEDETYNTKLNVTCSDDQGGETEDPYTQGLEFTLSGDESYYTVSRGTLPDRNTDVIIPATYKGKPVTAIAANGFAGKYQSMAYVKLWITNITIPASITTFGSSAFSNANVTNVYYGGSLDEWMALTFSSSGNNPCNYGTNLYVGEDKTLPNSYSFPAGTTTVGCQYNLYGVMNVTSVVIPASVTEISANAFYSANYLTNVTIGNETDGSSLAKIGSGAFYRSSGTVAITYHGTESDWRKIDGYANISKATITYTLGRGDLPEPTPLAFELSSDGSHYIVSKGELSATDLVIPATYGEGDNEKPVTEIKERAFSDLTLNSITIPASVTTYGNYAFSSAKITSVYYLGTLENWLSTSFYSSGTNPIGGGAKLYLGENKTLLEGELVIPTTVTAIGNYALYGNKDITSAKVQSNVSVGTQAFNGCEFTCITVGENVTDVASWASLITGYYIDEVRYEGNMAGWLSFGFNYSYSPKARNLYIGGNLLTELEITENMNIPSYAFNKCTSLTTLYVKSGNFTVGNQAFGECSNLKTVKLASSVTAITSDVFNSLSINKVYFEGTANDWLNIAFSKFSSNPLNKGAQLYIGLDPATATELTTLVVADGASLKNYAFYGCNSLTSIEFAGDIATYGSSAIYNCNNLVTVKFATAVVPAADYSQFTKVTSVYYGGTIGDWLNLNFTDSKYNPLNKGASLYIDNVKVTSVTVPNTITEIKAYAFYGAKDITSVTFGSNVTAVLKNAFDSAKVTEVHFNGDLAAWLAISFANSSANPLYNGAQLYFGNDEVTKLVIPANASVKANAFYGCKSLIELQFEGAVEIGSSAFSGCTNLATLRFSTNVPAIDYSGFNAVTAVYYGGTLNDWLNLTFAASKNNPLNKGATLYIAGAPITSVVIPDTVTAINAYAFYGSKAITSITFPATMPTIGTSALEGTAITEVHFKGELGDWLNLTFASSSANPLSKGASLYLGADDVELTALELDSADGITAIGKYAFYGSGITSVTLTGNISIGESAFGNCKSLTAVTINSGSNNVTIGERAFYGSTVATLKIAGNAAIGKDAFKSVTSLTSLDFAKNYAITIGESAFESCSGLVDITLNSVTSIGVKSFYSCGNLASVVFDSSLTEIGRGAGFYGTFESCSKLKNITLYSSIEYIGKYSFASSPAVTFYGTEEEWNAIDKTSNNSFGTITYATAPTDAD